MKITIPTKSPFIFAIIPPESSLQTTYTHTRLKSVTFDLSQYLYTLEAAVHSFTTPEEAFMLVPIRASRKGDTMVKHKPGMSGGAGINQTRDKSSIREELYHRGNDKTFCGGEMIFSEGRKQNTLKCVRYKTCKFSIRFPKTVSTYDALYEHCKAKLEEEKEKARKKLRKCF